MLRLWTINGKEIERKDVEIMINTLQYTAAPEGLYVNALIGGLANGNIRSAAIIVNCWCYDICELV